MVIFSQSAIIDAAASYHFSATFIMQLLAFHVTIQHSYVKEPKNAHEACFDKNVNPNAHLHTTTVDEQILIEEEK